ncbi:hypothetical protein VTK73DRAFT_8812 [Phialemonium thermophilum]|uniref:Alpha-glucuronidase n=1 Tax=Phialemonium thermophilum TaxID=223376 RepID=A0ABR3W623_9PEZI
MVMRRILLALAVGCAAAEDGLNAWLRYAPLPCSLSRHHSLPESIIALNSTTTSPVYSAGQELHKGLLGIFGKNLTVSTSLPSGKPPSKAVVVGTVAAFGKSSGVGHDVASALEPDGFWLEVKGSMVTIVGQNERGALYGAFQYLSLLARADFSDVAFVSNPAAPVRWTNEWDNLDGSIEHQYGGPGIWFQGGHVVDDLTRAGQYARLLSSVGINAVIVNNVNADANILTDANMQGLGRLADAFRPYGVQLGIALNFASPQSIGGLSTFDPLDPGVIQFWTDITDKLYQHVPDLAGYLVKANSEGQPGPLTYNRTLADGANLFARPLQAHGGVLMFRAFVYNNNLNESDWKADRANAAVQFFDGLDGKFEENVVVQVKYGPIDFQVREPTSPLFAHLSRTNAAIELEVAQEYLGQQCHLVYLAPLWKTVLDFDLRVDGRPSLVRDIVTGRRFKRPLGGFAGVANVGTHPTWLGSHLATANLYAFGRLAWDPSQTAEGLLDEWVVLTFGHDRHLRSTLSQMALESWPMYENYTGNLGIQTLTDILYTHYGPNPASMDNNGWGQWTRADAHGIGMDRTVSNGTGFAGQYPPEVAAMYESLHTVPDELLLWFHHVPYTQRLRTTGETVIQHFYNAHYAGAETAATFPARWASLRGKVDSDRYDAVLRRLIYQAGHAIVWRDAINEFYRNKSSIEDERGRVGHHPWRVEAEDMTLAGGYSVVDVTPFETASGFRAVVATKNGSAATATTTLRFPDGTYDLVVGYFDQANGRSRWAAYLNDKLVGSWVGDGEDWLSHEHSTHLDGHSATRVRFPGVKVRKGDVLRVEGTPDGGEMAPLDYVALLPDGVID